MWKFNSSQPTATSNINKGIQALEGEAEGKRAKLGNQNKRVLLIAVIKHRGANSGLPGSPRRTLQGPGPVPPPETARLPGSTRAEVAGPVVKLISTRPCDG